MSSIALDASAFAWTALTVQHDSGFSLDLPAMEIEAGSFTFIVGRNGAGKSTLLRALGRQNARKGSPVSCFGRALGEWKDREFAKTVAYLPQDRGLQQPDLLAAEVVRLGRFAHGYSAEDHSIVEQSLAEVDASHLAQRSVAELSGGERQRIWIAMALAQRAKVILLDEPTTFLDWQHQLELVALLTRLNRLRGVTIVAVLHDLNLALSAPAQWLVLDGGSFIYQGEPSRFLSEWDLAQVFGVQAQVVSHGSQRFILPSSHTMHATVPSPVVSTPRCPVRSQPTAPPAAPDSLFVEKAAADLSGSEVHRGDPAADALLQAARQQIYYWPEDFAGFCGRLTLRDGGREYVGGLHAQSSRRYTVDLPECPDEKWVRYQIEELVAHRESTSVSHIASKAGVVFGDDDPTYGQRVDFVGDKMQSFYRLKDNRITQIGRGYGKVRFVINIDEHCVCDGRFAAQTYNVFYFDSTTGKMTKTETYLDRYAASGGLWLPVERRVTEASDSGIRTRQLLFTELHVISHKHGV